MADPAPRSLTLPKGKKGCLIVVETTYGGKRVFSFSRNGLTRAKKYGEQLAKSGSLSLSMLKCDRGSTPLFQCSKRDDGRVVCSMDFSSGSDQPLTGNLRASKKKLRRGSRKGDLPSHMTKAETKRHNREFERRWKAQFKRK